MDAITDSSILVTMPADCSEAEALVSAYVARDHSQRARAYMAILIDAMVHLHPDCGLVGQHALDVIDAVAYHDVGKTLIPKAILMKPGALTAAERECVLRHAELGGELIDCLRNHWVPEKYQVISQIVRGHHERWDGSGYPLGLAGNDIPLYVQLASLADVYDALSHKRTYKPAYSPEETYATITAGECGCFSPTILECFSHAREALETFTREDARAAAATP